MSCMDRRSHKGVIVQKSYIATRPKNFYRGSLYAGDFSHRLNTTDRSFKKKGPTIIFWTEDVILVGSDLAMSFRSSICLPNYRSKYAIWSDRSCFSGISFTNGDPYKDVQQSFYWRPTRLFMRLLGTNDKFFFQGENLIEISRHRNGGQEYSQEISIRSLICRRLLIGRILKKGPPTLLSFWIEDVLVFLVPDTVYRFCTDGELYMGLVLTEYVPHVF